MASKLDWLGMTITLLAGFIVGAGVGGSECIRSKKNDPVALQTEFDGYRHCLQSAGQMRCRMTPQDFVRYHQIKRLLDWEEPGPWDNYPSPEAENETS